MSVALGQSLLDDLTNIIESITEGSGFSFAETFPDITPEAENVTSEIIDGINSLSLDDSETEVLLEVLGPIFEANSSANDTISAFQGLFEAAIIEGFLTDLSESIPSLVNVLGLSTGQSDALAFKLNTIAVLMYALL